MSMRENPGSGYVVDAYKMTPFLPESQRAAYEDALENCDRETAANILGEHLPQEFPMFSDVYIPTDEDTVDDPMETGGIYVIFDEEDLYVRTPKPEMEHISALGVTPEFVRWSVWG